jgi:hypothetical protein
MGFGDQGRGQRRIQQSEGGMVDTQGLGGFFFDASSEIVAEQEPGLGRAPLQSDVNVNASVTRLASCPPTLVSRGM